MVVYIDDLTKQIEEATNQEEQCQALLHLQQYMRDVENDEDKDEDFCIINDRDNDGDNKKKKNETEAVRFLLQRLVPINSHVTDIVQDILSECSPLLVWEISLDTLHALTQQKPSMNTKQYLPAQSQTPQPQPLVLFLSSVCLEITCKALLRLIFSAPPSTKDDHDHTKIPFVVNVVVWTTNFSDETSVETRKEILVLWIQSILRLPLMVANACDNQRLGLPRIWTAHRTDHGFYVRLLQQAINKQIRSVQRRRQQQQQREEPKEKREVATIMEEYVLTLVATLIQQRGAIEIVARVFQSILYRETMANDHILHLVALLSQKHYLSPRQCAMLWKAFWQCSHSTKESSTTTTTTTTLSDWGIASGRALLASHAVQEATVHEMLYHAPTTTQTEIHGLVQVLLSLDQSTAAELDDEESDQEDEELHVLNDPPEWTYGQRILAQHATLVARQWSSRSYIRQTDPALQVPSGQFLEMALAALKGIDLSAPLILHIVDGVSPRLESLQPVVRHNGMRVAEAMAQVLGQDLSFDEIRREDATEKSRMEPNEQNNQEISGTKKQSRVCQKQQQKSQSENPDPQCFSDKESIGSFDESDKIHDDESVWDDGDEDFQPYGLDDDEEDLRETARPTYLRDCLDLLRTPESEDFARSHHETALQELPALVRARPMDLMDVAPSLAMQVLRMENKFNLDGFDGMVTSCLVALVVEQPVSVGETMIHEIFREGSLADRLKSLGSLSEGAYELSGFKDQDNNKGKLESTQRLLKSGSKVSGRRSFVPDNDADLTSPERTRRWGRKETKMVVNRFSPVAPVWFYALLGNFVKRREDAVLWGGSVGSMLLSKLLLTLAMIVELSGRGRTTETMAKDLFDCVWGFHQAEVSEVRIASLCAVTAALSNMQDDMLLQILYEESVGNLSSSLKQIVTQDPDQECRNVAAIIAKNVARTLESMGPLLMPAASK